MARKRKTPTSSHILVRATVNMHGLRAGRMAWVDPNEDWIKKGLEMRFLVKEEPLPDEVPPAVSDED